MADFGTGRSAPSLRPGEADAREPSIPPAPPSVPDPTRDLAGALHEVSNALTVLMGWIGRARDAHGDEGEIERALDVAAGRAAQARAIVRRAIGAEVEADAPASTADVVRDAVLGLDPEAKNAGVTIVTTIADDVALVPLAGATEVVQILTNLLLNAIAVSPSGGRVTVEARAPEDDATGSRVLLAVVDEGPGISIERRATLFDGGASTRRGGAGIGLRYAATMARRAGGSLRLAPAGARGARFELAWGALGGGTKGAMRRPSSSNHRGRLPLEGTRILILEDDAAVVDLLDTALTARGADVVSIRRRDDLEGALGSGRFDAALFDISPIHKDIQGAIGAVRDKSEGARLVLISGSAESMPPLPAEWIAAWVRKPFEIAEILAALAPRPT